MSEPLPPPAPEDDTPARTSPPVQPVAPLQLSSVSPAPADAPTLAYVSDEGYRATGKVELRGVVAALVAGLLVSVLAAGLAMAWMLSRLPNWLILPMVAQ